MKKHFNNAVEVFNNFDEFFDQLIFQDKLFLDLQVLASEVNGSPILTIKIDNELIRSDSLSDGVHLIKIEYDVKDKNQLLIDISMSGKQARDTLLHNGIIIKDKFIKIENLKINNYDITLDPNLFYSKFKYKNNNTGKEESAKLGFWTNASLLLNLDLPFITWYQENSFQCMESAGSLIFQDNKILADEQFQRLLKNLKLLK